MISYWHSLRIAVVAPFTGLHYFPQGQGFKQWTSNDSKALMKVSALVITSANTYLVSRYIFQQSRVLCPLRWCTHYMLFLGSVILSIIMSSPSQPWNRSSQHWHGFTITPGYLQRGMILLSQLSLYHSNMQQCITHVSFIFSVPQIVCVHLWSKTNT